MNHHVDPSSRKGMNHHRDPRQFHKQHGQVTAEEQVAVENRGRKTSLVIAGYLKEPGRKEKKIGGK
jgi:hypothetical protein